LKKVWRNVGTIVGVAMGIYLAIVAVSAISLDSPLPFYERIGWWNPLLAWLCGIGVFIGVIYAVPTKELDMTVRSGPYYLTEDEVEALKQYRVVRNRIDRLRL